MTAARKLAAFAAALAIALAGAAAAGALLHPGAPGGNGASAKAAAHDDKRSSMNSMTAANSDGHGAAPGHASMSAVRGLGIAEDGLRLVIENGELRQGQGQEVRFRIVDERGRAVRDFDLEHTKRMHLIVVRRDLTGFQHLHPTMHPGGSWSTMLRLGAPGSYRLFADFSYRGKPITLAGDLRVDGYADLRPIPAPTPVATTDGGYQVRLETGKVRAGTESVLRFTVTQHGRPVAVEQYLGADGHLVALRDGDLAFLHVHPTGAERDAGNPPIRFEATFPTAGAYRLFLQFKDHGTVHTVAFTQEVR